jgi:glycerophosphoryl diester phosphodiesterase
MADAASVLSLLDEQSRDGPLVVAHRGDSANFPENTLPAFASALRLGVTMQEFDVRQTRDGTLVCLHDATLDRTTDAASRLGPGALVAQCTWPEVRTLDAGSWRGESHRGTAVPSLAEVLDGMAPACIAMVEHKAGDAGAYVGALRRAGAEQRAVLQSFDWPFVAAAHTLAPSLALALLGPTTECPWLDRTAIDAARHIGAGMLHWHARDVTAAQIALCHDAGLLVCTYTTDDELGMCGGAALGIDAMCTNVPSRMLAMRAAGRLRRRP